VQVTAFNIKGNNMQKIVFKFALVLISALAAPFSPAQDAAPDVLLKTVTLEVIAIIRQDKDIQAGNPAKVADLVETRILPLFDFTRMTQLAMARNWRLATPEQQKALTTEFKTLLVRTYSTALSSYRGQAVEFKRLRAASGDTEVTVNSVMKQPGTEPLTMDYDMEKIAAGWKVYDIKIDGVSLITTYRETFAGKVREGGVDGLIKSLADKNRQGDARFRAHQTENFYFPTIVQIVMLGGR
jgi:phospholipid transport system substrate-binding protein